MPKDREEKLTPEVTEELQAIDSALAGEDVAERFSDLAELAVELREQRPKPRAEWGSELDRKVALGFSKNGSGTGTLSRRLAGFFSHLKFWSPSRLALPALGSMAAVIVAVSVAINVSEKTGNGENGSDLGGSSSRVSAPSGSDGSDGAVAPPTSQSDGAEAPQSAAETGGDVFQSQSPTPPTRGNRKAGGLPSVPLPTPSGDGLSRQKRKVEESASLTLTAPADRIQTVADGVVRVTDSVGGIVANSSVETDDEGFGSASFELHVPIKKLELTLSRLAKLAHVQSRTQDTADVTDTYDTTRDRLVDYRAERKGLLRRLERAKDDTEITTIKSRLELLKSQIAQVKGELRSLNQRTTYSVVQVSLESDEGSDDSGDSDGEGWALSEALDDAVDVLTTALSITLVVLAVVVPPVLLIAIVVAVMRRRRRRRREQALAQASETSSN